MTNSICNVAFDVLSETKYEEALTPDEKEMTKQILNFLREIIIYGKILSNNETCLSEAYYRETAASWEKEYQALKKYIKKCILSLKKKSIKSRKLFGHLI